MVVRVNNYFAHCLCGGWGLVAREMLILGPPRIRLVQSDLIRLGPPRGEGSPQIVAHTGYVLSTLILLPFWVKRETMTLMRGASKPETNTEGAPHSCS